MARRHAEIAGAGFAGLTLAAALAQRGWSVRVHERSQHVRAFGSGIWFWENGLRVLNAIGSADEAMSDAVESRLWKSIAVSGRQIERVDFGPLGGPRVFCLLRDSLLRAILYAAEHADVEIVTNSDVVGALPDGGLELSDGTKCSADLGVAADGVHSRIRDALGLLQLHERHVDGEHRLVVPRHADDLLAPDAFHAVEWWGPPRRFLLTPVNNEVLYLAMAARQDDRDGIRIPIEKESWIRSFPQLERIIGRIGSESRYDSFETIKLKRWSAGRIAVVGDAAHSMTPGLGQGASTSMVNALGLAVALDDAPDVEAALSLWEARERPLTEHTQRWTLLAYPHLAVPAWRARIWFHTPVLASWIRRQRLRPARHIARGTEGDAPWRAPEQRTRVA